MEIYPSFVLLKTNFLCKTPCSLNLPHTNWRGRPFLRFLPTLCVQGLPSDYTQEAAEEVAKQGRATTHLRFLRRILVYAALLAIHSFWDLFHTLNYPLQANNCYDHLTHWVVVDKIRGGLTSALPPVTALLLCAIHILLHFENR